MSGGRHVLTPAAQTSALGNVSFDKSSGHVSVINYGARLYADGTSTPVLASVTLGKPQPAVNGRILVDLFTWLNSQASGDYDVRITSTDSGGTSESGASNSFTIPLTSA